MSDPSREHHLENTFRAFDFLIPLILKTRTHMHTRAFDVIYEIALIDGQLYLM